MMAVTAQMRVLVCVEAVDFRKGIDGLARVCREALSSDPFSGTLFVFRNRRGTAIKILAYDGQGFWLCQKRLSEGRFRYWPGEAGSAQRELLAHQLQARYGRANTPPETRKLSRHDLGLDLGSTLERPRPCESCRCAPYTRWHRSLAHQSGAGQTQSFARFSRPRRDECRGSGAPPDRR